MTDQGRQYHIQLDRDLVEGAEYVLLPGDPGRVAKTALHIDPDARQLGSHREYTTYLGRLEDHSFLVCSTGIGGPGTAVALEELAAIGLKYFVRIGTTGAIQSFIGVPSLIISLGAVRLDGTSTHYAPIEYPAVADFELTNAIVQAARELQIEHHIGVTASSDSFYPGQERYDSFSRYVIQRFQGSLREWRQLNVLNYEMEAATLFTVIRTFGLQAACVCSSIVNRSTSEHVDPAVLETAEENLAKAAKRALAIHMEG